MNPKTSIIITSISRPNAVMQSIAAGSKKNNVDFIVMGDVKSPVDFKLDGCRFFSVTEQNKLVFKLAKLLPVNHYSRKNLGYLLAKDQDVIIETDDDNFPREEFWETRDKNVITETIINGSWTNAYKYFSEKNIWPRGFPLELISAPNNSVGKIAEIISPIQQGLADENPDVDAVYRMCMDLPVSFNKRKPLAFGKSTWCPFNSQNTTWFKEAFPLLYLPSFCSFRMTDIWRSFVAQRIAWTCGWTILYHNSTVWQERNEHNLIKDFKDEIPGYLNNVKICKLLEDIDLQNGINNLQENLMRCYKQLTENNFISPDELSLVEAWIMDFETNSV